MDDGESHWFIFSMLSVSLQAFGPVEKMDENVVTELRCMSKGFSNKDLQTLPFSMDNMEEISPCDLKDSQVKSKNGFMTT